MTALELKNDLLRLMFQTNDVSMLTKVHSYFKALRNEPLTKEEIEAIEDKLIEIGMEQIKKGQVISHEEARRRINARLYNNSQ